MISHDLKCIFIHVSRTGGKSIEKVIWNVEPKHGSSDHRTILQWQRKLNKEDFNSYFKFAFCRNPWDRMVSLYSHYRSLIRSHKKGPDLKALKSFEHFVRMETPFRRRTTTPIQLSWIKDLNGKPKIDFVGRFENFEKDWNKVCKIININKKIPHLNKSKHDNYKKYYTKDLIKIVGEKYKEDVEYFDYKF